MYETLILNNGKELSGYFIETETRLFLYTFGLTLSEAFELFSNPDNIYQIRMIRNQKESQVEGYNHLYSISEERGGMICSGLKKVAIA